MNVTSFIQGIGKAGGMRKLLSTSVKEFRDCEELPLSNRALFKNTFWGTQELTTPQCKKSGRGEREVAWLSKDLLVRLREKKVVECSDFG